jgi:hypothetical protein
MDIQKVFRGISKKLMNDFEISAQINHNGNIGSFRENALKEFLEIGRLPKRYGIGNGEIVGHISNVSRQSDLIIFDQLDNIPLLYDTQVQVYPIDCVYGIVEVKSKLSKEKLLEGLENIKSFKQLSPNDSITKEFMFLKQTIARPRPFGFIFAYSLAGNSIDSLVKNLKEWEQKNSPEFWPNLIVVLGEGIIYHSPEGSFSKAIFSESINADCYATSLHHKDDSFFYFYSYLLDLCNNTELPKVELSKFLNLPHQQGKYIVKNNDRIVKFDKDGKVDKENVYRFNEKFIDKIVDWCKQKGTISQKDLYLQQFGHLPQGIENNTHHLESKVYFYNPDGLLGMHEVENAITIDENKRPVVDPRVGIPSFHLVVDNEVYYFSHTNVDENDYEKIPGKRHEDL